MKRRDFIRRAEMAGAGMLAAGNAATAVSQARTAGGLTGIKNIVAFFVDQQRADCLGCYGNGIVKTPNLDRLARNGVRFTNAYTPAPVCTPARMSFQSGMWAHQHKLTFNTGNMITKGGVDDPDTGIGFFSDNLKNKGWRNAHIGKWHIGTKPTTPSTRGYDEKPYYPGYGYPSNHPHYIEYLKKQGVSGFNLLWERKDPTGYRPYAGLQEGPQSASIPAYLASQTVETVKEYAGKNHPFFIGCNFWGPHAPYNITKEHLEMYRGMDIPAWPNFDCPLDDKPGVITRYGEYWKSGWFNRKDLSEMIGEYYGYITLIDEEIGRVMKAIEDAGEFDNTLFIYTADHGSSVGSYRIWDKGFGMYDCITRIPLVISHPSVKAGVSDAFVNLMDLAPTFLDVAGCDIPAQYKGASLVPILTGASKTVREDYIVTEHHGHQMPFWQRMVRTPSFKYIFNPTSRDEFYDLDADPWETRNIIETADKKNIAWARDILLTWMQETNDPCRVWALPVLS